MGHLHNSVSKFKILINFFSCTIFTFTVTPLRLAFSLSSVIYKTCSYIIDISFFTDINFNFHTAYYDNDYVLIDDRKVKLF